MSDLLRRLVGRALGLGPAVQPVVGTRFGREPVLLSEQETEADREAPRSLPPESSAAEEKRSLTD